MSVSIADIKFEPSRAILSAYEDENVLVWDIEIDCRPLTVLEAVWTPHFETTQLARTSKRELRHWSEFKIDDVQWRDGYDEVENEFRGQVYVFEHAAAKNCKLSITHNEAARFHLDWTGSTDIFFSKDKYWNNVPFQINAPLFFDGVLFGRMQELEARQSLNPYFPHADLIFNPGPPTKLRPQTNS